MKLPFRAAPSGAKYALLLALVLTVAAGCSVRRYAVNMVGDALAAGNSVYETDEDLELVGQALPFGLKLMESLLEESPDHAGLLLTSCKGFVLYSLAYVDYEATVLESKDMDRARATRDRARKLYQRALQHGLRGLETRYPQFGQDLMRDPRKAVGRIDGRNREKDLPFLYWSAAALGLGISISRGDAAFVARLPEVTALIDRGLELDETWGNGAFHQFKVQLAGAAAEDAGRERIRKHYERALELSGGRDAGLFVAYAEAVSIPDQDREAFLSLMGRALAVDTDRNPQNRLANLVAQRKARWLVEHVDDLILE